MDVKIDAFDTKRKPCGDLMYIDSFEELLQRVKIACTITKGSFVYDTSIGCMQISTGDDDTQLLQKLEMVFKEATINIGYDSLNVLEVDKDRKIAVVQVKCQDCVGTLEVTIDGKL